MTGKLIQQRLRLNSRQTDTQKITAPMRTAMHRDFCVVMAFRTFPNIQLDIHSRTRYSSQMVVSESLSRYSYRIMWCHDNRADFGNHKC